MNLVYLIGLSVIAPLVVLNLLSGAEAAPPELMIAVRGALHLWLFVLLLVVLLLRDSKGLRNALPASETVFRILITAVVASLAALSIALNDVSLSTVSRFVVVVVFSANLLIIYPFVVSTVRDFREILVPLQQLFIAICWAILAVALVYYLTGTSPYYRLGYPLIPGVFAYYMTIGFLMSITTSRSHLTAAVFLIAIVISGSRSMLLFALASLLLLSAGRGKRMRYVVVLGLLAAGLFLLVPNATDFLRPYMIERDDLTSNRLLIWAEALNSATQSLLFGYGTPQVFDPLGTGKSLAAHNSFLDMTLTYGIIYAAFGYLVWLTVFLPRRRRYTSTRVMPQNSDDIQALRISLFALVTFKSLVSNTFWTNMGDAATLAALLILLLPVPARRRSTQVSAV